MTAQWSVAVRLAESAHLPHVETVAAAPPCQYDMLHLAPINQ
jgi:hypothetical protein